MRRKIREVSTRATLAWSDLTKFGLWLSLVERLVRDQEAVGSNPTSPITCVAKPTVKLRPRTPVY